MSARTGFDAGGLGDPALTWYGTEEACQQMSRSGMDEPLPRLSDEAHGDGETDGEAVA